MNKKMHRGHWGASWRCLIITRGKSQRSAHQFINEMSFCATRKNASSSEISVEKIVTLDSKIERTHMVFVREHLSSCLLIHTANIALGSEMSRGFVYWIDCDASFIKLFRETPNESPSEEFQISHLLSPPKYFIWQISYWAGTSKQFNIAFPQSAR